MAKKRDPLGALPDPEERADDMPDAYYPEPELPPEAPQGLDPSETPIGDSPRRGLSAHRFGNPRKQKMIDQRPTSDSVTEDEPMEPGDQRTLRDAEAPPDATDPGITASSVKPRKPS